ncbi:MAG: hypothetical protein IJF84_13320 [Thermoguttaceae bacterium]|nr:hypothetical protein [Thermoguttaceae bacterium]
MSERLLGCIPSYEQAAMARAAGLKSDEEVIESLIAPWNVNDTPRIIEWSKDWTDWLKEEAATRDALRNINQFPEPWKICENGSGKTFTQLCGTTQQRNDCAAWGTTRAAEVMALNQYWFGAERRVEAYNPTGIYAFSSGDSPVSGRRFADNGRTIYSIAKAACEIGNFPVSEVGEYNGGTSFTTAIINAQTTAEKNQTGFCYVGDRRAEELAEIIILSLRAGHPVVIGNDIALRDGTRQDSNGMTITDVGGGWGGGHCTSAIDYRKVGETEYVYIVNSHGLIYRSNTDIPGFGAYITKSGLVRYLSGRFSDIMPLTYTERPVNEQDTNLNPHGGRE